MCGGVYGKLDEVSVEKIAVLAEKGLKAAHLTKKEKKDIIKSGVEEIYNVREFLQKKIPLLDNKTVSLIMNRFYIKTSHSQQFDICVQIGEKIIKLIRKSSGWLIDSPAFATRVGDFNNNVSFHKKVGKLALHLEIIRRDDRLADINVKLTDNGGRKSYSFEVELIKDDRCIETIHTTNDNIVSFLAVEIDDYKLKVSDKKSEIASLSLRIQK